MKNVTDLNGRLQTLSPSTIKSAFRKTGVWPFDPSVVTEDMMGPSKESSCEGHLPLAPAPAVQIVAKLIRDLCEAIPEHAQEGEASEDTDRCGNSGERERIDAEISATSRTDLWTPNAAHETQSAPHT